MSAEDDLQLCPCCAKSNASDAHFCEHCAAPLTGHAATDPMGQVYSQGHMYRQATDRPSKAIVVMGMWLLCGPMVLVGGMTLVLGGSCLIADLVREGVGTTPREWYRLLTGLFIVLVFGGGLLCIGSVLLYRTTSGFLKGRRADCSPTDGDALEVVCEECNQPSWFPSTRKGAVEVCPHCGAYVDVE